ncbi:MAG: hypothetical protein JKY88_16110 [Pseudomonadales bacterium]|nr:hypothetical protein [Pseudomonadales bacterium]
MKAGKIVIGLAVGYIAIVVIFESMLGFFQPENASTFIITITNNEGKKSTRVLTRNLSNDQIYASANHWPRAWYHDVLENPTVQIDMDGIVANYLAIPVDEEEHKRVDQENPHSAMFKFLIGFAPREILRLVPITDSVPMLDQVSTLESTLEPEIPPNIDLNQ